MASEKLYRNTLTDSFVYICIHLLEVAVFRFVREKKQKVKRKIANFVNVSSPFNPGHDCRSLSFRSLTTKNVISISFNTVFAETYSFIISLIRKSSLISVALVRDIRVETSIQCSRVYISSFKTEFDLSPKKLHQRPFSSSNMSHLRMIRISFDQARAIAIQSAILYHTRTAKQILSQGTLEGINETKCTQLLRMSLYRCCIHRENVSHCN